MQLTLKQKISYTNHLIKSILRQDHKRMKLLLSKYINEQSIVVDVGGHAGQFTKIFAELAENGQVFSFEPSVYSRSILQTMVGIKFMPNVFVLPFGLGSTPKVANINTPVKKSGSLGYGLAFVGSDNNSKREMVSSEIRLSTIDFMMGCLAIQGVDFIKADIEGSELEMLRGAEKTLREFHPVLMIELNDESLARNQSSSRQLIDFVKNMGYRKIKKISVEKGEIIGEYGFDEESYEGDYIIES